MSEGFLTIAYGAKEYIRMARALALSYQRFNPSRPIAVVTDERNIKNLRDFFDIVIPLKSEYGNGVVQKLHMDLYSPFEKTVFIDSDCLFYKDPQLVWNSYNQGDFSMRGWRYLTGYSEYEQKDPYLFLDNVGATLRKRGLSRFPHFNSGVMGFAKNSKVFELSREIYRDAGGLGFTKFKNAPLADEPVFALAMEQLSVELMPWDNVNGQETAIGMDDCYGINIIEGKSKFIKNGVEVEPAVIHFNSGGINVKSYFRDICRLEARLLKLPIPAYIWANVIYRSLLIKFRNLKNKLK